jgi:hypothetical protein
MHRAEQIELRCVNEASFGIDNQIVRNEAVSTSPKMTAWSELNEIAFSRRHSNATGLVAIRGGFTSVEGTS